MASIFNLNRIRDHKAAPYIGKALVYGIGTKEPSAHAIALQAHDFVFNLSLTEGQRRAISPKWMGRVIKAMLRRDRRLWKDVLADHLSELGGEAPKPILAPVPTIQPKPVTVRETIAEYNRTQALDHYAPYFPSFLGNEDRIKVLLSLLVTRGTLMEGKGAKVPIKALADLLDRIPAHQHRTVRVKLVTVQALHRFGDLWAMYCQVQGIEALGQFDHGKGYIAWRKPRKLGGTKGQPNTKSLLNKELTYFRNVCHYATRKRWIGFNPMDGVTLSKMESHAPTSGHRNYPLPLPQVLALFECLKDRALRPGGSEAARANYLTAIFLLATGCRPKEASQWSVVGDFIQFHHRSVSGAIGGKTKNAFRRIPLTRTLRTLAASGMLSQKDGATIAPRLSQYFERIGMPKCNPYRLRHTACSLLWAIGDLAPSEIAYRMGHSDPAFSYSVYGDMGPYLGASVSKDTLRGFWSWLQDGILSANGDWFSP
jgi:integrase